MNSIGIRISDDINNVICVKLSDILAEAQNGSSLYWSILFMDVIGNLGEGKSVPVFEELIRKSENGFLINWEELNELSRKIEQTIDITIIGCYDQNLLRRYESDQEMYETCDIVIEMLDSSYWEVFSKNPELINKLSRKFKDIKFLEPDFQKDFYK